MSESEQDIHRLSKMFANFATTIQFDKPLADSWNNAVSELRAWEVVLARYEQDRRDVNRQAWRGYHQAAITGLLAGDLKSALDHDSIVQGSSRLADKAMEQWNKKFDRPGDL